MEKFKLGDRIRIVGVPTRDHSEHGDYENGDLGVVIEVFLGDHKDSFRVDFDEDSEHGKREGYVVDYSEAELDLVYYSPLMKTLRESNEF